MGMAAVLAAVTAPGVNLGCVRRRLLFFRLFTDYLVAQRQALVAYPRCTGRRHGRDPVAGLPAEAALSCPGLIPHLLDPGDRRAGRPPGCGKYRVHTAHAAVADIRARPGDQLLDLLLALPAKRAREMVPGIGHPLTVPRQAQCAAPS